MDELDLLATLAGLPIPAEYREGVLRQWRLNKGLPILAMPIPVAGSLPVSVQLIGPAWAETTVLRAGRVLEHVLAP